MNSKTTPVPAPATEAPAAQATAKTVSLTIDFGDSPAKEFAGIPWTEGMTVLDAMVEARRLGLLKFEEHGTGQTAFVESINGRKNAGAAATDRNWLFSVNGQQGDEGAGVVRIQSGDRVLWKFATGR
ncbi:MAG: DUF4430 domain-containing protein [Planctomycetia bacterium]|nr:DUF4430 domain-containing protein [Planctomycetia bacterium]